MVCMYVCWCNTIFAHLSQCAGKMFFNFSHHLTLAWRLSILRGERELFTHGKITRVFSTARKITILWKIGGKLSTVGRKPHSMGLSLSFCSQKVEERQQSETILNKHSIDPSVAFELGYWNSWCHIVMRSRTEFSYFIM